MAIGYREAPARQWIDTGATGAATAANTYATITWSAWNRTYSTSSTSVTGTDPWIAWNGAVTSYTSGTTTTITINQNWQAWNVAYTNEAEAQAAKAARVARERHEAEEWKRREAERAQVRRIAIRNADRLLDSILSGAQRDQLKRLGGFVVRGQSGRLYRIRMGRSANVDLLDASGKVIETLCAYPRDDVPDGDTMAAQKIMLECDEAAFLRLAIKHPARGQPVALPELVL